MESTAFPFFRFSPYFTAVMVNLTTSVNFGRPVTCLRLSFSEVTERIDGWETVASRQRCDLRAMGDHEGIRHNDKAAIRLHELEEINERSWSTAEVTTGVERAWSEMRHTVLAVLSLS